MAERNLASTTGSDPAGESGVGESGVGEFDVAESGAADTGPVAAAAERSGGDSADPGQAREADELVRMLTGAARQALEVGVGLGVLGLLRFRSERPRLEAELERLGLAPIAGLSRRAGELLDRGVALLMKQGD